MNLVELSKVALNTLRTCYQEQDALDQVQTLTENLKTELEKDATNPNIQEDVFTLMDYALRQVVDEIAWKLHDPCFKLQDSGISELLDVTIQASVQNLVLHYSPYRILEDLMEGITIQVCEKAWELLEERKGILAGSDFISKESKTTKAKFCLLRMANALLRRLSKTQNTEFCGRVLGFLSHAFSLTERSALNVTGKTNLDNVTLWEDEETFLSSTTDENHSMDERVQMDKITGDIDSSENLEEPIDYKLYKVFWGFQRFFQTCNRAIESSAHWEALFREADIVLSTFEGNPFSPADLAKAKRDEGQVPVVGPHEGDHFFQPKYLTSSSLFRLQLRDPILRQSMLTQCLVLFQHLLSPSLRDSIPQDIKTPKNKLSELQHRVHELLKNTPPNGEKYVQVVGQVLEKERNWVSWKQEKKCSSFEKHLADEALEAHFTRDTSSAAPADYALVVKTTTTTTTTNPQKRQKLNHKILRSMLDHPALAEKDFLNGLDAPERNKRVKLDEFVEAFTEAWDPANDIEEQYWPDKDPVHCWRTLRSTWGKHIVNMKFATRGASEVVRQITGIKKKVAEEPASREIESTDEGQRAA